jgi:hypothetical protein
MIDYESKVCDADFLLISIVLLNRTPHVGDAGAGVYVTSTVMM